MYKLRFRLKGLKGFYFHRKTSHDSEILVLDLFQMQVPEFKA